MKTFTHVSLTEYIDARRFEEQYPFSRRTFFAWIAEGKIEAYRPSSLKRDNSDVMDMDTWVKAGVVFAAIQALGTPIQIWLMVRSGKQGEPGMKSIYFIP